MPIKRFETSAHETLWVTEDAALVPELPLVIARDGARMSLFTVIATFGTAREVTVDELRIESLFLADERRRSGYFGARR